LCCDNVFPEIGGYGIRPIEVARCEGGWQAACKLPPGLGPGPTEAIIRTANTGSSFPVQIVLGDQARPRPAQVSSRLILLRVADGKTLETGRVRVGPDSGLSAWALGLPAGAERTRIRLRLNGTDLPANWLGPANGNAKQINAALPAGLEPGRGEISLVFDGEESAPLPIELTAR